ncbi:MAG TPA: zinc ribbon domain-containing protein [Acidimicrobiales bacterium]|nr:zinc ribbon domain-containing protein [Acidimicrobiales bacterium]
MSDQPRLVPYADRDSAPWWAAVARHELVQQRCDACATWRWPPRAMCGECASFDWSWQPIVDTGTVVSWIRTHHAFLPGFHAPYETVFVRLHLAEGCDQDDIVMPGTWFGTIPPKTGMIVQAHFDDIPVDSGGVDGDDHVSLVGWKPAGDH